MALALALAACKDEADAGTSDAGTSTGNEGDASSDDDAGADDESGSTGEPPPTCGNGMLDPGEVCDEGVTDRHGPTCNAYCEQPATRLWTWDPGFRLLEVIALEGGDVGYLGWVDETEELRVGRMSPPSQVVWEHGAPSVAFQSQLRPVGDQLVLVGRPLDAEPADLTSLAWSWAQEDGAERMVALPMGEVDHVAGVPDGLLVLEDGWPELSLRLHDADGEIVWTAAQDQLEQHWEVESVVVVDDTIVLGLDMTFGPHTVPEYAPELQLVGLDGQLGARVRVDVGPINLRHLGSADGRLFAAGTFPGGAVTDAGGWIAEVGWNGEVVHAFDDVEVEQSLSSFVVDSFGHPIVAGMRDVGFNVQGDGTLVRYGAQGPSWSIGFGESRSPRVWLGEDDRLLVALRDPNQTSTLRAYTP